MSKAHTINLDNCEVKLIDGMIVVGALKGRATIRISLFCALSFLRFLPINQDEEMLIPVTSIVYLRKIADSASES